MVALDTDNQQYNQMALADKCSRNIRSKDFIARYGGDEFIVALQDASMRDTNQKAKKLCKAISGTRYSLEEIKAGPDEAQQN